MKKIVYIPVLALLIFLGSCNLSTNKKSEKMTVVTTTTMITDIITELGKDKINVHGLMGAGVDPHLYKASEGDVNKLFNADLVFYNGLHLEGKLEEIFEKMQHRGVKVVTLSDTLDKTQLIQSDNFASNYDPHVWFNMVLWRKVTEYAASKLVQNDPVNKPFYEANLKSYLTKLDSVTSVIETKINEISKEKRILITAHDAFNYFGQAYDFEVLGLQGISTTTEAGVKDVQKLANLIVERKVKAIFIESSVSKRNIEALQAAVKNKGFEVNIGGELFSDACGDAGSVEGTYLGMFMHNVNTIVEALK
jgi:manganese/zinc/iron transport system substrate-binding protein